MDNKLTPGQEIKTFTTSNGNTVVVRLPLREDVDEMLRFVNELSTEDTYVSLNGQQFTKEEESAYIEESLSTIEKGDSIQLLAFIEGKLVANAGVSRKARRHSHIGNIDIAVDANYREEGIGQELMKLLIVSGREMGLKMLTLSCFANNPRALHVYEKLGFKETGRIPNAFQYKNGYVDEVIMYQDLI